MKILIIVPTLNEKRNIEFFYKKIKKERIKYNILFIDDNSKDGSQELIKKIAKKDKKISYIFRAKKMGIGSAHKAGLRWCYKKRYHIVITIDVDGTHDPKYIKLLIRNLKNNDIVITNRFTKKGSLRGWPIHRIFLTYFRYLLVKSVLSMPYDSSGAFRCINCKKIPLSDLILAKDDGYSFFWESVFLLQRKKYKIFEVGIPMPYRQVGSSHMKLKDIYYAFFYLFFVFIKKIFGKYNY